MTEDSRYGKAKGGMTAGRHMDGSSSGKQNKHDTNERLGNEDVRGGRWQQCTASAEDDA